MNRLLSLALLASSLYAQAPSPAPTIEDYEPKAMLVVPKTTVNKARYPFIDIHTHQRPTTREGLDTLARDMDTLNMRIMISSPVSGSFGAKTKAVIDNMKAHPQASEVRQYDESRLQEDR